MNRISPPALSQQLRSNKAALEIDLSALAWSRPFQPLLPGAREWWFLPVL